MDLATILISAVTSLYKSIAATASLAINVDQRFQSLKTALEQLQETKDNLKRQVDRAELEGLNCRNQVKGWLKRAENIEVKARLIVSVYEQRRQSSACCNANYYSTYKLSKKVLKYQNEISELVKKVAFGDAVADMLDIDPGKEIPISQTIGLHLMLEKVQQFLAEDEVGMIGIYGMGGVGKTTLLKIINNKVLAKSCLYDTVIWVVVSKDFVVDKIQQVIASVLHLAWEDSETHEQRAMKIYRIMRRKKFLLLLDDVWEGIDLQKIGIPLPDKTNKCKVMFTARSLDVCSDMGADRKLKVEFLGEKDSWKLFCNNAGGNKEFFESQSIRPHAETIVRKCGGLPLALITIGRAMENKETEEEWKYAVEELNRSPSELRGMEDVFTLLKFSYDNLKKDILKLCFLYCSLFPEDYSIEKEQLIQYWIGEGYLDNSHESYVYNKGHDIIGSLKVACLLESGEEKTQVKMHDVVRSFALWIASECGSNKRLFLVEAYRGLTEAPRAEDWKHAQRISLLDNGITTLAEIPECLNLSTLLLQWNSGLNRISDGFFQFMPVLRVLDLSFTSVRAIPASINKLIELRHLDLSGTKISALPKEVGDLPKLEYLDLQRMHYLKTIPRQAISGLLQLRVLNFYYSYGGWEELNQEGENEVGFAELHCLKHLKGLGITVNDPKTLKSLHNFSRLLKLILYLYIKECEGLFYLKLSIDSNFGERLRRLSINNCLDLEFLLVDEEAGEKWLPCLEVLALHGLPNLSTVWKNRVNQQCLQNLRYVNIWHCNKLKNVSWVLHLPKLEVIYLMYCKEMEEVVSRDAMPIGDSKAFPTLRTLSIRELPKLTSVMPQALFFPSLKSIAVIDCPNLKKLPVRTHNMSELPTVYGDKEWWDGLEWDAGITGPNLPHFMSI